MVKGWQVFSRSAIHFARGGFLGVSRIGHLGRGRNEERISGAVQERSARLGYFFGLDRSLDCFKINESRVEVVAGNFPGEHLEFPGVPAPAEMGKQFFNDVPGIEIVVLEQ